jgi:hypothetical protein
VPQAVLTAKDTHSPHQPCHGKMVSLVKTNFPVEISLLIFDYLDLGDLINLSEACSRIASPVAQLTKSRGLQLIKYIITNDTAETPWLMYATIDDEVNSYKHSRKEIHRQNVIVSPFVPLRRTLSQKCTEYYTKSFTSDRKRMTLSLDMSAVLQAHDAVGRSELDYTVFRASAGEVGYGPGEVVQVQFSPFLMRSSDFSWLWLQFSTGEASPAARFVHSFTIEDEFVFAVREIRHEIHLTSAGFHRYNPSRKESIDIPLEWIQAIIPRSPVVSAAFKGRIDGDWAWWDREKMSMGKVWDGATLMSLEMSVSLSD